MLQHTIYKFVRNMEVFQDASGAFDDSKLNEDDHEQIGYDFFATIGRLFVKCLQENKVE